MDKVLYVVFIILCVVGTLTLIGLLLDLFKSRKKFPVSTLYLKEFPDGTKQFRLGLKLDLDKLNPGDKFEVIVDRESINETDIMLYNEVKEN